MAGMNITREHADMLVVKLEAEVRTKKEAHDLVIVYYRGTRIANFGIRRNSKRDKGHGHIPRALFISPRQCRLLAICDLSVQEWWGILRSKGLLPDDQPSTT
jgi:hypothetical protein